jgi:alpha-tubulin suppressor-like RCC1 family protein
MSSNCDITAVITWDGKVYTWKGYHMSTPNLLTLPSAVISVSIGVNTILAVTVDGSLHMVSGSTVTLITLPTSCREVACRGREIYALTMDGSLYSWRDKDRLAEMKETTTPVKVVLDEPVSMIVVGEYHTLILTVTGQVYSYGCNDHGQLGVGSAGDIEDTPTHVPLPSSCKSIACGSFHSFAVLETGEVYGWGDSSTHELGSIDLGKYVIPTRLEVPKNVSMIAGGFTHSVLVTEDGRLYFTGDVLGDTTSAEVEGFTEVIME